MSDSQIANVNGLVPAAAGESKQRPSADEVKKYLVPITVDKQMMLTGHVKVHTTCAAETVAAVQVQTDNEALDDDIEMEDADFGYTMSHPDTELFGSLPEIVKSEIEVDAPDEVTFEDVLRDVPKPFEEARALVRSLRLESEAEYKACFDVGEVPSNIPQSPDAVYKDQGWIGWADWLRSTWLPFGKAREFARGLGLKSNGRVESVFQGRWQTVRNQP